MSFGAFAQNVTVTSPASIAGDYLSKHAGFGTWLEGQSGELVLADDGTGVSNGCTIANDMTGKIALVDRGVCGFAVKALNAQNAGAIAVVVCNNLVAFPDSTILMGGFDCSLTIPAVMLSVNQCNTIKAVLAAEPVAVSFPNNYPGDGNGLAAETLLPGAGTYTTGTLVGLPYFTDADSASYFKIVATADGIMNVNSCLGGVDTRLTVLEGCRGSAGASVVVGANDDACELEPGGDAYASSLDVIVRAGNEYIILWDSRWTSEGFDFNVSFSSLTTEVVNFQVDMQDQTVAPDGVKIVINGGAEADMTNSAGSVWTYSTTATAGDELDYVFLNGSGNPEDSIIQADCRTVEVGLDTVTTNLVCYNSCSICPPDVACPNWIAEDFEGFSLGTIGNQDSADPWTTWTLNPGGADDAVVTGAQHNSGAQSLEISNAAGDDVIMELGNRTAGNYILKWKMYIPTGESGYYNIQKDTDVLPSPTNADFAMAVTFNADGTGTLDVAAIPTDFTYPQGVWFDVYHEIDLDNDWVRLNIAGQAVYQWPMTWDAVGQTGYKQLGGVDFYGNTGDLYYVDDVLFKEVDPCPADALICDGFDGYDLGLVGPQSPWWATWTAGSVPEEGTVVNEAQFSCEQSLKISEADPDDAILLLGEHPDGNYTLSWKFFIPTGSSAYYNTQKFSDNIGAADGFGMQVTFNADGTASLDAGGTGVATFNYPQNEWFEISHGINIDLDEMDMFVNGTLIYEWPVSARATVATVGAKQVEAVDFFGNAGNLYYIDDVLLIEEEPTALPDVPVTFQVDMTWEIEQGMTVSPSTVKIAGNFTTNGSTVADWTPPSSPVFTAIGNDIYEVTIMFPATSAGQTLQYKFLNTPDSWGACGVEQECFGADSGNCTTGSGDFNRALVIPEAATTFCYTYNTCEACNLPNSTSDLVHLPMTIAPNPFSSKAIVTFHTPLTNAEARLTTMTGQLVRTYNVNGSQLTIEKNSLSPGMYFFNVVTENGTSAAQKLIIE